jgi:uncharacterized membrane protein YbhN (UPF0104 family)
MKRHFWLIVRLLLTVALFGWLLRDGSLREHLASVPPPVAPGWLGGAWLSAGLVELSGVLRWWCCLHLAGVALPLRRAAALYFLGLFTSLFLPGMTGGDAVKIALVAVAFPDRRLGGLTAVLMERLSGFVVIAAWTALMGAWRADWFAQDATAVRALHTTVGISGGLAGGLLLWFVVSRSRLMQRRFSRFPFRKYVLSFESGFDAFASQPLRAVAVLSFSAVCFAAYFLIFHCTARAYGAPIPLVDMFSVMPLIDTITMLPVTISGLGLREMAFQILLPPLCGVGTPVSVIISLVGFLVGSSWALVGAPVFLGFRPMLKPAPTHG